jgi:hypothetical protein
LPERTTPLAGYFLPVSARQRNSGATYGSLMMMLPSCWANIHPLVTFTPAKQSSDRFLTGRNEPLELGLSENLTIFVLRCRQSLMAVASLGTRTNQPAQISPPPAIWRSPSFLTKVTKPWMLCRKRSVLASFCTRNFVVESEVFLALAAAELVHSMPKSLLAPKIRGSSVQLEFPPNHQLET